MRFRYRAARFVLPRAALKCRVPVAGEAPAVVVKVGRARVVPAVAVMVLGQVAQGEIRLPLLLLRVILVVMVLTTSMVIMAVGAAVALAVLAILVSIMVRTWQEPLKVGVVKAVTEEEMDGEMEVPNGAVAMVRGRTEAMEEGMEVAHRDMAEVLNYICFIFCHLTSGMHWDDLKLTITP